MPSINSSDIARALSVICLACSGSCNTAAASSLRIVPDPSAAEEVVFDDTQSRCEIRQFPDSPPRAVRHLDGAISLFATFETNWYLSGNDWRTIRPVCASAGQGSQDPDPDALNDKYWIQALHSLDGQTFIALGSHEYLGSRHSGRCTTDSTPAAPFPCWYSAITQYVSRSAPLNFVAASESPIVARPQVRFDSRRVSRTGYFTTSNIVSDGLHRYVLIFQDGIDGQKSGNCLFRANLANNPTPWRALGSTDFDVDLTLPPASTQVQAGGCRVLPTLGPEVRSLVRHRASGLWIAIYNAREGTNTGIYYSMSDDLVNWRGRRLILAVPISREDPSCPPVYRYPSLIDHGAPGFSFDTVGERTHLYIVKIILRDCRQSARQIVRVPITIDAVP